MNPDKEPKHLYTIRYTIQPNQKEDDVIFSCLQELAEELANAEMDAAGYPEANEVIARIKAQL